MIWLVCFLFFFVYLPGSSSLGNRVLSPFLKRPASDWKRDLAAQRTSVDCDTAAADGVYYWGPKAGATWPGSPQTHTAKAEQLLVVRIPLTIFASSLVLWRFGLNFGPSFVLRPYFFFLHHRRRQLFNYFSVSFSLRLHFNDKLLHLSRAHPPTSSTTLTHLCVPGIWINIPFLKPFVGRARKKSNKLFRVFSPYVSRFLANCLLFTV